MAWNRPTESAKPADKKKPSALRGVVAGFVVVALAAACVFIFMGEGNATKPKSVGVKAERIKDIASEVSAPAKTNVTAGATVNRQTVVPVAAAKTNAPAVASVRPSVRPVVTNRLRRAYSPSRIFKYHYQNELASYMTTPPGTMIVGTARYTDRFVKQVVETMSLPIEDEPTDTPEQRALRQDMRQVMKELQAQVDSGRDVREIFTEIRNEMQSLGLYKASLESELKKIYRDESKSEQDIEDAIAAANIMLDSKGIAPLKLGGMTKKVLQNSHEMGAKAESGEEPEE